jgi:O-acetyl-ADP-ribose deacetylase (regulator of RNase III)
MPPATKKPICFVIMPFGEKADADGTVIFDTIYDHLIKDAVESLDIECLRCDKIDEAGWIHRKMFEQVYAADIAVVDITQLNANVFYELGVRHALADRTTVLIKKAKTKTPFNIGGLNIIEYDLGDLASIAEAKKKIVNHVQNGLRLQKVDSPVHEVLDLKVVREAREITTTERFEYEVKDTPNKRVGIITGNLLNVRGVDVWVSSENTDMEMARLFDRSISSVIRYYGAKRDKRGRVVEDTIANELAAVVDDGNSVPPGHVVATRSGSLLRRNQVKRIFHAAAVQGQTGKGYSPISDITECVRNALDLGDEPEFDGEDLASILFPIMGTGTGRADIAASAHKLIHAAVSHLQHKPPCRIDRVYFIALTEEHLTACQQVLEQLPDVTIVAGS